MDKKASSSFKIKDVNQITIDPQSGFLRVVAYGYPAYSQQPSIEFLFDFDRASQEKLWDFLDKAHRFWETAMKEGATRTKQ
jgi:hypothetical protein